MKGPFLRSLCALGVGLGALLHSGAGFAAATFVINIGDGPGEGFNDPAPITPRGGNPGVTLGNARYRALQRALEQIGCQLDSAVPIVITATFDPLSCNASSALIANAGASSLAKDFPNAPLPGTYYAVALANSLAGVDLAAATPDVSAAFNSGLGSSGCLASGPWYYGFDAQTPPSSIDFVTIAMHETLHGLGFQTYVNLSTGAKLLGSDDAFMLNFQQLGAAVASYPAMTDAQRAVANESEPNLVWAGANLVSTFGGPAPLYAPNPVESGSSLNHFSFNLLYDELMSPFFIGPTHSLGRAFGALTDSGWRGRATCVATVPAPAAPPWGLCLLAATLTAAGVVALGRRLRSESGRP